MTPSTQSPKPVLAICGHQRSGTTLLTHLCSSHPALFITNEFQCFWELDCDFRTYLRAIRTDQEFHLIEENFDFYWLEFRRSNRRYRRRFLLNLLPYAFPKVRPVDVQRALHRTAPGHAIVGDKYPEYIWRLDRVAKLDNTYTIVIYRDCRDVVRSTLEMVRTVWKTWDFAPQIDTAAKVAGKWVEAIEMMEAQRDHIHIVRYEDLITEPEHVVNRMEEYLGVDAGGFDVSMIDTRRIGKHKRGLTEAQLEDIERVAGDTMRRLGYD